MSYPFSALSDVINFSELVGRSVSVVLEKGNNISGKLHNLSNNGVLVKTTQNDYRFVPWWNIRELIHTPKKETTDIIEEEVPLSSIVASSLVIEDSAGTIRKQNVEKIEKMLNDTNEYNVYYEEDEEHMLYVEDSNDVIIEVDTTDKKMTVFLEEEFEHAKEIAGFLKLDKIIRDYSEEE